MLAWYCSIPAVRITQCENEAVKTAATDNDEFEVSKSNIISSKHHPSKCFQGRPEEGAAPLFKFLPR